MTGLVAMVTERKSSVRTMMMTVMMSVMMATFESVPVGSMPHPVTMMSVSESKLSFNELNQSHGHTDHDENLNRGGKFHFDSRCSQSNNED